MISLIFLGDLRYCPYLTRYTERLKAAGAEFEVLFWNRGGFQLELEPNYKYCPLTSPDTLPKAKKLVDFYGFRRWVKKQLKLSRPEGVVFLSTLSAMVLNDVAKEYKGRYIYDIRDYSYEHVGFYKKLETRMIEESYFTAISSKGFRTFLPEHDYVIAHNFNRNDLSEDYTFVRREEPLQIVWNGMVRFFDYQQYYLDLFKNDPRFELVYHGSGSALETYQKYCQDHDIQNVRFTGGYDNRDKAKLVRPGAFLNNCYGGREGKGLLYAISNRYYDSMIYHIPQLVETGGFKAGEVERNGIGLAVEPEPGLPDRLYDYYNGLDPEQFNAACDKALQEVLAEDDNYVAKIDAFIGLCEKKPKKAGQKSGVFTVSFSRKRGEKR